MAKSQLTVSVDADLREHFANQNLNVSKLINDFLRGYKDKDCGTVDSLNFQIKKKEFEAKSKQYAKMTAEMQSLQVEIESYQKKVETEEIDNLKRQKERQNSLTQCQSCGKLIDGPIKTKGKEHYLCLDCLSGRT